jgi:hypothetical protein
LRAKKKKAFFITMQPYLARFYQILVAGQVGAELKTVALYIKEHLDEFKASIEKEGSNGTLDWKNEVEKTVSITTTDPDHHLKIDVVLFYKDEYAGDSGDGKLWVSRKYFVSSTPENRLVVRSESILLNDTSAPDHEKVVV